MVGSFDYNNDDVMKILNNPSYTDEEKKSLFEKYKADLKDLRRKEIVNRLNDCAKNNPIITEEEYVNFLRKYNDDDLSKPFEVIEKELEDFNRTMDNKYQEYLKSKEVAPVAEEVPEVPVAETPVEEAVDEEITPDVTPFSDNTSSESPLEPKLEETTDNLAPTVFEDKEVKEVMPEELPESKNEKGNASAIIVSIIAIVIGMVIMYTIIKLK